MYSSSQAIPGGSSLGKRKRNDTVGPVSKRKKGPKKYSVKQWYRPTNAYGFKKYSGEGPFPNKLATTLLYRSVAVAASGSAGSGTFYLNVGLNDLNDFDISNLLGNKQPLYYDQLFSSTGPYQRLECLSWRTRITIINTGAECCTVYWNGRGSAISVGEEDTLAEVTNRPHMQQYTLAPKGSTGDRVLIRSSGKWMDHNSETLGTAQNLGFSPGQIIYGTLFANTPTSTTAPTLVLQFDHYFDIIALRQDATVS